MPLRLQNDVPLAPLTTFRIGGPARYFAEAVSESDVVEALDYASSRNLPVFILGGGSNILVSDSGFPGLVLKIAVRGAAMEPDTGRVILQAGAGEDWNSIVDHAVNRNLAGVECLSGIPGSVGGTPVQNVGAYGQEVAETILLVRVFDRQAQVFRDLTQNECGFKYRTSIFNSTERDRHIVTSVRYALTPDGPAAIRYSELVRRFENGRAAPTLAETAAAVRAIRASKGMLIQEGDPDCRSAGSFFKNPILSVAAFDVLVAAAGDGPPPPRYPAPDGQVKTSAAWLIERAGFPKGYTRGAAALSTKHTLAIVNPGAARAADILELAREIRVRVEARFGVRLTPEPVFIGFET